MDFAFYGEVMRWDSKKLVFTPYNKQKELSE